MSKTKPDIKLQSETQQDQNASAAVTPSMSIETEDLYDDSGDEVEPESIFTLARLLVAVSQGGPITEARLLTARLCPGNVEDAAKFVSQMQRLRAAAEACCQTANEAYASITTR